MCAVSGSITNLEEVFGANPGDDQVLIDWEPMCDWLDELVAHSPNLEMETIGLSTDGNELRMILASSPETIRDLSTIRQHRTVLKRVDSYSDIANENGTLAGTKPVILITAGIHATEVGGVQMMPSFLCDLVSDPTYQQLLESVILLVVPTLNPDGMDMVHRWYRDTLGTASEGTIPPALYHKYAGHDNNRDWYQRRLQETRVMIDQVHRQWMPHVVIDLHQMGQKSPRYVVPPYIDPAEAHVHPLVYQLAGELGSRIAADNARAGNRGVCSGVMFDCYSPTRAYMHYHGGVRILAEAASVGIASPVHVAEHEQHLFWDTPPQFPSVHMPWPWRGGQWHLSDIIRLHRQTIDSVVASVAENASRWIADQWKMFSDQVNLTNHGTNVISPLRQQLDPAAARELIDLLRDGDVEIYVAEEDDGIIQAGSFVIPVQQPFGSYASALLSLAIYPPGQTAYDVTSHSLPVHMGVQVEFYDYIYSKGMHKPTAADLKPFEPAQAADIRAGAWLAIDSRSSAAVRLVNHAISTGSTVKRLAKPHIANNRLIPSGSWIIADSSVWDVMAHASEMHVRTWVIPAIDRGLVDIRSPKIGLYNPEHSSMSDYGWLTLWLERSGFQFEAFTGADIIHRGLDDIDVFLMPHGNADALIAGHTYPKYPERFTRGLSDRVISAIRTWLHRGGHLIAFEGAVSAMTTQLNIDLKQPLLRLPRSAFASSGAVVRVNPASSEDVTLGIEDAFPAMYLGSYGYEIDDRGRQHSIARFAREDVVVSGAIRGEDHLAGLHAIVQMNQGEGCFTAFAFRPHFRTQMLASEHVLTNAILQQFGGIQ